MFPRLNPGQGNSRSGYAYARDMSSSERIVVLAGNLREFHAWCHATGHSPRERGVKYATGPHTLHALDRARVVRYGTWQERPDSQDLQKAANRLEQLTEQTEELAHA